MEQTIMVACDLHDQTMVLRLVLDRGAAEALTVRNTPDGRRHLIQLLHQRAAAADQARVVFAYEASGLGFGLHDELTAAGIECHVLAPTLIQSSVRDRRRKTDAYDAEKILKLLRAHVLAGNELPSVWIPAPETRDDRELVRLRLDVAEKGTAVKSQIRGLLKRNRQERPAEIRSATAWTRALWRWLEELTGPPSPLGAGARAALASLLRQLHALEQEREALDKELETLACGPRYAATSAALRELVGVGPVTALVFLTELGDLTRFRNRRQIAAFLGLAPSSYESGEASDRKGHITRQGPSRVRKVLCQASWSRVRCDPQERITYTRLVNKNPQHKKIAVVACMRRLAIRMWHTACDAVPPGETRSRPPAAPFRNRQPSP